MAMADRSAHYSSPCLWFEVERPVVGRVFVAHRDGLVLATNLADPPEGPVMDGGGFVRYMHHRYGVLAEQGPVPDHEWPFSRLQAPFDAEDLVDLSSLREFRRSVMKATARIAPGEVWTYGDVAEQVGDRKAAVAVGQAMKDNPAPLVIPCHRVVGAGKLGGWVYGQDLKRNLLADEGVPLPRAGVRSSGHAPGIAAEASSASSSTLEERIAQGESQTMEFKSSAGLGHKGTDARQAQHEILKTVCAFLNRAGGELVIGVNDDGELIGVARPVTSTGEFNRDRFQLLMGNLLRDNLSTPTADLVDVRFKERGNKTLCLVSVRRSPNRAVWARPMSSDGKWQQVNTDKWNCWVRDGPSTRLLQGPKLEDYIRRQWPS